VVCDNTFGLKAIHYPLYGVVGCMSYTCVCDTLNPYWRPTALFLSCWFFMTLVLVLADHQRSSCARAASGGKLCVRRKGLSRGQNRQTRLSGVNLRRSQGGSFKHKFLDSLSTTRFDRDKIYRAIHYPLNRLWPTDVLVWHQGQIRVTPSGHTNSIGKSSCPMSWLSIPGRSYESI